MSIKSIKGKIEKYLNDEKNVIITALIIVVLFISSNSNNTTVALPKNDVPYLNNEELIKYESRVEELEEEIEEKNTEIQNRNNSINTITEQNKELEEKISNLTNQKSSLEEQVSNLTSQKSSLEAELNALKAASASAVTETASSSTKSTVTKKSIPQTPNVSDSNSYTVYITNSGSKYHRAGCRYLKSSQIEISKSDAISRGYTACSVCNP